MFRHLDTRDAVPLLHRKIAVVHQLHIADVGDPRHDMGNQNSVTRSRLAKPGGAYPSLAMPSRAQLICSWQMVMPIVLAPTVLDACRTRDPQPHPAYNDPHYR